MYCKKCGKKMQKDSDGDLYCPTIDKIHGFCCNNPDCEIIPHSKTKPDGTPNYCSECNADCSKCEIVVIEEG